MNAVCTFPKLIHFLGMKARKIGSQNMVKGKFHPTTGHEGPERE